MRFPPGLASLLAPLNSTMIAVALPEIRSQFHVGVGALMVLVSTYLIAVAVSQPVGGRLGDAFGQLTVVRAGLVVFAVSSIATAFAWDFPSLVVLRSLQGVAAALVAPNISAYLRKRVAPQHLGKALGFNGAATSFGAAIGPVAGGLLLGFGSWRLLFLVNVPLALLALALMGALPSVPGRGRAALNLDIPSLAALAAAFAGMSLLGSSTRLPNPALVALGLALFPVAVAAYAMRYRQRGGVVDLRLFSSRTYWSAAAGTSLSNLVMYTTLLAMPVYLGDLRGLGDAQIGFVLFALSFVMVAISPVSGAWSDGAGARPLMAFGAATLVGVMAAIALGLEASPILVVVLLMGVLGFGFGLQQAALQSAGLQAWPREMAGSASGTLSMMRYVGSVTGAALLALILGSDPGGDQFRLLFAFLGVFALANVAVALASTPPRLTSSDSALAPSPAGGG